MEPNPSGLFTLNEGVLIIPVTDLPEESRTQMEFERGDFAVSRLQSRSTSKIIEADAADLLSCFREPRTLVEAVILFARKKQLRPIEVLEDAYPFFRNMIDGGFLIRSDEALEQQKAERASSQLNIGMCVNGAVLLRTLHVLEDTEVYLLSNQEGLLSALKIERLSPNAGFVRARLRHEAAFLAHLDGSLAPRLLRQGELDGRFYLEMEFIQGVDLATASAEWRERKGQKAQRMLLGMAQAISRTYAGLHDRGILHGDVHPSNILVGRDASVRLVDFGVARARHSQSSLPTPPDRSGVAFFFEPEMAAAALADLSSPPVSQAGEQHAVAALIYLLMTGTHWQNFRLGREEMLKDIATLSPLSFGERGRPSWPELEAALSRALAKSPEKRYPSMGAFADALAALTVPPLELGATLRTSALSQLLDDALVNASLDGPWSQARLAPAPTTSIDYGSAGVALGLLHVALRRSDGALLALADTWSRRAMREMGSGDAFYNKEIEITPEIVGKSSPYHSPSGIYAVATLVAAAAVNPMSQAEGLAGFIDAVDEPSAGLDLTLGRSSILLGAAILLDTIPKDGLIDPSPLRNRGDAVLAELWQALDAKPEIKTAGIEYLGIAHGWAGFLYATLQWCNISKTALPKGTERRLVELAALALPVNRGMDWPWTLGRSGEPSTMSGWCNGAAGYVFLWSLAHRLLGDPRYFEVAHGAAWRSWDALEENVILCCGLAGRAYALLNFYRHTNETVWLDRARDLALRAARAGNIPKEYPHSLYKGKFGLAVLAADLEQPDDATMPFFEPIGYENARD